MRAELPVIDNVCRTARPEQGLQNFAALVAYFVPVGLCTVALLDIRGFEPLDGIERCLLAVTGEAPGANRRSHQVHRTAELGQQALDDDPVDLAQHQPFRATGCTGDGADTLRGKAAFADVCVGGRTGFELESH